MAIQKSGLGESASRGSFRQYRDHGLKQVLRFDANEIQEVEDAAAPSVEAAAAPSVEAAAVPSVEAAEAPSFDAA